MKCVECGLCLNLLSVANRRDVPRQSALGSGQIAQRGGRTILDEYTRTNRIDISHIVRNFENNNTASNAITPPSFNMPSTDSHVSSANCDSAQLAAAAVAAARSSPVTQ